MASALREIPPKVWEQHKNIILGLRFRENLPLDGTKASDRNVIQVMRDEHQFEATPSQYETQLKKWKAAKNMKSEDWRLILPIYHDLEKKGFKPRVRLGDQILDEKKVKKARRHLRKEIIENNRGPFTSASETRTWCLEFCQPSGHYIEYSGNTPSLAFPEVGINDRPLAISSQNDINTTSQRRASIDITQCLNFQPTQNDTAWEIAQSRIDTPSRQLVAFQQTQHDMAWTTSQPRVTIPDPGLSILPPTLASNITGNIEELTSFPSVAEYTLEDPQILQSDPARNDIDSPTQSPSSDLFEDQLVVHKGNLDFILEQMYQGPIFYFHESPKFLNTQAILDQIQSLFQENLPMQEPGNDISLFYHESRSITILHKRILQSIFNSFSGLKGVPLRVILDILEITPGQESNLLNCLRSKNINVSKPLADNIFRATIVAGDDESLRMILKVTLGQPNEIDVNGIICEFNRRKFTPLALATYLHHLGITKILLEYGAQVYIPREQSRSENCALRAIYEPYVLQRYRPYGPFGSPLEDRAEATQIVKLLLRKEPGAVARLLMPRYFSLANNKLLEILFEEIPTQFHSKLFVSSPQTMSFPRGCCAIESGLGWIIRKLDSQAANRAIRNLMLECQTMGCEPTCSEQHPKAVGEALNLAIMNCDFDLAQYLLGQTQPTMGNLTAAIRAEQMDIVDLILKRDDIADSKASCYANPSHMSTPECNRPTTPLAEAIRLKNDHLIKRLEENGLLYRIYENIDVDLEAAVSAAVEANNFPYLRKLLAIADESSASLFEPIGTFRERKQNRYSLDDIIVEAIDLGHFEMAIELIVHLERVGISCASEIFCAALEKKNREFLYQLLDFPWTIIWNEQKILVKAVQWGDKSIIEDLLCMGIIPDKFRMDPQQESPLSVAIETHNEELAVLLLDWGFNPSELTSAVRTSNESMLQLLLRYGASPCDDEALSLAVRNQNYNMVSILLSAYSTRYPEGRKQFGGQALRIAIETRNSLVLDLLLGSNLDLNSSTSTGSFLSGYNALSHVIITSQGNCHEAILILRQLIEAGADPDAANASRPSTALLEAIKGNKLQIVELLLDKGADINRPARLRVNRTPLQQACEKGSFQTVEFLIARGADVNAPPAICGGATAIQLASIQGSERIVRLLLDNGAEIHAKPALIHGRTALQGAAENGRLSVLEILLAEGAACYDMEAIASAKSYAEKSSHRGCKERLELALLRRQSLCL